MASASSVSGPEKSSTNDEFFMHQSLLFADTLKDLKNLRKQLYSAAEFFEISYSKESQKRIVVESVKDYTIKALINTVDHLGSIAFKVNNLVEEKFAEASQTGLQLTCLEQRVKSCQEYTIGGGLLQHSLVIIPPKHHKGYILTDEETTDVLGQNPSSYEDSSMNAEEDLTQLEIAAQVTTTESPSTYLRQVQYTLQSPQPSSRQGMSFFTRISGNKTPERRAGADSPLRFSFVPSGSPLRRSSSPSHSNAKRRSPGGQFHSLRLLKEREAKIMSKILGQANAFLRPFSACTSLEKISHYTNS
ncbi:protein ABIL3-like [Mangifera indica]|uniref:protein ABIL3-like n=1 Tax=Mangifera indica TaxID=29780 RepID=UPI001CFB0428|nr:protein ABIL3-like [Mangifera indica]